MALAGVGLAVAVAGPLAHPGGPGARPVGRRAYVVRPGDTLWGIARRMGDQAEDPRALIDAIARANDVRGSLVPGQTLVIPAS